MPSCDKCKKEVWSHKPIGLLLFRGKCEDCFSTEDIEALRRILPPDEVEAFIAGLQDATAGRLVPTEEVRRDLVRMSA